MKKAFEQNVSRAKPRLRLGGMVATVAEEQITAKAQPELAEQPEPQLDLAAAMKARVEKANAPKLSASEAVQRAIDESAPHHAMVEQIAQSIASEPIAPVARARGLKQEQVGAAPVAKQVQLESAPVAKQVQVQAAAVVDEPVVARAPAQPIEVAQVVQPVARAAEVEMASPIKTLVSAPVAAIEPPSRVVEVQTEAPPAPDFHEELSPELRRERLKERLKSVRENPRPEPLPATVAETGLRAVERISGLQTEVTRLKALNLALTQDLEAARRTAEKATEEARSRMEEARRLTTQMEERAKLLSELERELSALEGERDESLLKLQEARQTLDASFKERESLNQEIARRDAALAESLSEEERLAAELETAHEDTSSLRRTLDAVSQERDTLARQVSELTAERAELMEARRALEAVHRALSQAAAR